MATPEQQAQTMLNNLPEKTGKTLSEWLTLLATQNYDKHGKIVSYLKSEHQVTHGFANLIAHHFLNQVKTENKSTQGESTQETDLVTLQYSKGKEALRPLYDKLIAAVSEFGEDVEISPKKAYVSLRRKKQFELIQPSTKSRLDVGINLKDADVNDRLEASGSFNAMVSHRIRTTSLEDIDAELINYLHSAYQAAG